MRAVVVSKKRARAGATTAENRVKKPLKNAHGGGVDHDVIHPLYSRKLV